MTASIIFASGFALAFASFIWLWTKKRLKQLHVGLNRLARDKATQLASHAAELAEANRRIEELSHTLEAELIRRSEQVTLLDQKILEYADFNSHRLRAPLARIMGLTTLLHRCEVGDDAREIINLVDRSSTELDVMVKEINRRILADSVN